MNFRNAVKLADDRLDCEVEVVPGRWLPTTIDRDHPQYDAIFADAADYVPPDAAAVLAAERLTMRPFQLAFKLAARAVSSFDPAAAHLLETYQAVVAIQAPDGDIALWDESVTEVIRTHPDMTVFASAFRMGDLKLDALFRIAMKIEAQPGASIASEIAAFEALEWEPAP